MLKRTILVAAVAGMVLALAPATQADLLHHWKLDGDATDSVGGNNCTEYGGPTYVAGVFGQAVSLDGSTQYVHAPGSSLFYPLPDFTFTAWIQQSSVGEVTVAGTNDSAKLMVYGTGHEWAAFRTHDRNAPSPPYSIPTDGTWIHLAGTITNTVEGRLYLDGVLVGTNLNMPGNDANIGFAIGANYWSNKPGRYFPGLIDDVALFDHILSDWELDNVINYGAENYAIPEPATLALLGLGGLGLVLGRKRK